ncbi:MAG: aldehyde dehydrogenase family protein [Methanocorpusculum sp.]|jgi:aldehyde dehydrogenase (NAD+)|nr:aldehyde dehydrogenase family protein [Methanocorpusculum sp.]MDD3257369.1 aldehyde dehydrogenase family protein [Methanocorpusculum sp.]
MSIAAHRSFFESGNTLPIKRRLLALRNLRTSIEAHETDILAALKADLGKSSFEAYSFEIAPVLHEIDYLIKHAGKWLRPVKVKSPLLLFPAKTLVRHEPHGLVLLLSPWNYPFHLFMLPLAGMIAGGNVVIGKTSRRSPETAKVVRMILLEVFPEEWVSVTDEVDLTAHYDYIFFTGGRETGRMIAGEAAKNLTPITLELGGKNACVIDMTANIPIAAKRIAWGKCANAGQTCVAPDYLLVHKSVMNKLVKKIGGEIISFYGNNPATNPDYGKIVTEEAYRRLISYETAGNVLFKAGEHNPEERKIAPMILSANPEDPVMQEEIFGPILPVISWERFDELEELIKKEPLALYIFSSNENFCNTLTDLHPSGGVCINDVMMQVGNQNAPFGGVGMSGMGQYHGKDSLETFTRTRTVVIRKTKPDVALRYPPYSDKVLKMVKKWRKIIF